MKGEWFSVSLCLCGGVGPRSPWTHKGSCSWKECLGFGHARPGPRHVGGGQCCLEVQSSPQGWGPDGRRGQAACPRASGGLGWRPAPGQGWGLRLQMRPLLRHLLPCALGHSRQPVWGAHLAEGALARPWLPGLRPAGQLGVLWGGRAVRSSACLADGCYLHQ